jgi:hypothetical protein
MSKSTDEKTELKEDLGEIFDHLSEEDPVEEVETEESADDTEEAAAQDEEIVIEAADEESEESEETEEIEVAADEETEEEPEDDIEPLAHWLNKDKEMFKGLPKEAKQFLIDRDKEFQRHATHKANEVMHIKRALEPMKEELVEYGISDDQAVRTLVSAHEMLKKNPKAGIKRLMQNYRLTPEELFSEDASQPASDPRLDAIENKVQTYEQVMSEREQVAVAARIDEFRKNAEFFDEVTDEMMQLAAMERSLNPGVILDIERVYNEACWKNESVREKLIERRSRENGKAKATERSKVAASTKIRATPTAKKRGVNAKPGTIADDLAAVWDEVEERNKTGTVI